MGSVWVVMHVHEFSEDREDIKMIGVYSSEAEAHRAVIRLSTQPGFKDLPECFSVTEYPLDKDHWTEGYVTV